MTYVDKKGGAFFTPRGMETLYVTKAHIKHNPERRKLLVLQSTVKTSKRRGFHFFLKTGLGLKDSDTL